MENEIIECQMCGKLYSFYEMAMLPIEGLEDEGHICNHCYNKHMAKLLKIENSDDFVRRYIFADIDGQEHEFQIRRWINTTGVLWQAFEVLEEGLLGYRFEIEAGVDDDQNEALQKLYNKIQKGLSKIYIKEKVFNGRKNPMLAGDIVKGRIEGNEESAEPLVIVDGKKYTWQELGRMISIYEGSNFKLQTFNLEDDNEI